MRIIVISDFMEGSKRKVRRNDRFYNLFFIKPKENINAYKYAENLASIKNVAEVMITEGECGYIVKAKESNNTDINIMTKSRLARRSYKKIASYYQYRK